MARGWESKSVEDQQAEASRDKAAPKTRLAPAQIAREQQLQGLRLSRARVVQQLAAARDPRHRLMLERALAQLDHRIEMLQPSA